MEECLSARVSGAWELRVREAPLWDWRMEMLFFHDVNNKVPSTPLLLQPHHRDWLLIRGMTAKGLYTWSMSWESTHIIRASAWATLLWFDCLVIMAVLGAVSFLPHLSLMLHFFIWWDNLVLSNISCKNIQHEFKFVLSSLFAAVVRCLCEDLGWWWSDSSQRPDSGEFYSVCPTCACCTA